MSKLWCLNQSIGVIVSWSRDTVESILFARRSLPRTSFNEDIRIFRHALSVDERRVFYAPSLFGPPQSGTEQDVQELWFVGSHSGWCHVQEHRILPLLTLSLDVGGRWGKDTPLDSNPSARPNLSNISLLWMVLECKSKCNDIKFREDLQINLDAFHGCHLRDEIHDTLRSLKGCWWWILEVFSCVVIVYTCHLYLWHPVTFSDSTSVVPEKMLNTLIIIRRWSNVRGSTHHINLGLSKVSKGSNMEGLIQ